METISENGKTGITNNCTYFLIKINLFVLHTWSLVEFHMNNNFNANEQWLKYCLIWLYDLLIQKNFSLANK